MKSQAFLYDLVSQRWSDVIPPAADSPRTLVMAFGAPEIADDPSVFDQLAKSYPRSLVVGCSSAGEIHGATVRDRSLSVTVTRFDKTELQLASLEVRGVGDSFSVGQQLAKRLMSRPGLRGMLVLSEGLNVNGSELIRGLNEVLDESVVVTGGLSGDGPNFKRTWVAVGNKVKSNVVAAVGFYGDHVVIGHGSKGGWDKFGPERLVTRAEGNVLYELDGKPALRLYQQYLGDKAKDLPASGLLFPLSLRATTKDDKFVVRTLLSVDRDKQSLTFAGDIPRGHLAQLMKADFDRLVDGAGVAGAMAMETGAPPASSDCLVVAISCVGRRLVLGDRTEEEVEAVRDAVRSERAQVTGFYSYGEISPYATGHCDLHNQTMTLTTFSESPVPLPRAARGSKPMTAALQDDSDTNVQPLSHLVQARGFAVDQALFDLPSRTWSNPLPELDSAKTLVLAFGAPEIADDPSVFDQLAKSYPRSLVVGCSSAGEIHGATVRDRSLSVTVTRFDKTELQLASLEVRGAGDSFSVGQQLAKRLMSRPGLRGVLVLSEGLNVNGSELIRGLNEVLDESVVVTGGLSGDGPNFKRTWVAVGNKVKSNVVAAVGFYGDHVVIGHGSKGGWDKFGPERVVTRAEGNVLYELDGKPALQLYQQYLGDKAKDLPASGLLFPLSLRATTKDDKFVVRTLLSVDRDKQSLTFAGDIPRGHLAQLMKADFDRLVHGAGVAGAMAMETGAPPAGTGCLVVAISCVGRRLVLGDRTEEEVEAVRDAVRSERTQVTGFYSYGEISPYATGHCDLHNQTMTLTTFSESPVPLPRAARISKPTLTHVVPSTGARASLLIAPATSAAPAAPPASATPPAPPAPPVPAVSPAPAAQLAPAAAVVPRVAVGPIVRTPHPISTDAVAEISDQGGVTVVSIRGRLTEAFRGDALGRTLSGVVVFDLAEVSRVTSFGVREWLAMFAAASHVTHSYFARCSESVVNQLTMIRKFDGGAQVASFFTPYLCSSCGGQVERLLDCEGDAGEISTFALHPVGCPRCGAEARFDDDARSYLAFAVPHAGAKVPVEVRAVLDLMIARTAAPPADDLEMTVERDATRLRVRGKLSAQIRWHRVLDGLEGGLIVDLSEVAASDAAGTANLDQALHALPAEVSTIKLEHAPAGLIERLIAHPEPGRIRVTSAVVTGFCRSCAVHRPTAVPLDAYAADRATPRAFTALCKRCNGLLDLTFDPAFEQLVERQYAARPVKPPAAIRPATAAAAEPARFPARRMSWPVIGATVLLTCAGAAVAFGVVSRHDAAVAARSTVAPLASPPATATALGAAPAAAVAAAPPQAAVAPAPEVTTGWQHELDLPPAWVEHGFVVDGDKVYLVGHGTGSSPPERLVEDARRDATLRLIEQLYDELDRTSVRAFLDKRIRRRDPASEAAAIARFEHQHGKDVAIDRAEVSMRKTDKGAEVYVRYKLAKASYDRLVTSYKATARFAGFEVAAFFPLLEAALHASGDLVVITVDNRAAAGVGVREGDMVLSVGTTPVATVEGFRTTIQRAWAELEPRLRLELQLETAGALRTASIVKPWQP